MHPVLAPEILRTVFKNLDNQSNTNNALVCRAWSDVALDELWRIVDDLPRLFNILVPLNESHTQFSRHPTATDWTSFQRYTKRVRLINYVEGDPTLSQRIFDDIARTRTTLVLFPNIQELRWKASLPLSILFMSPTIKSLEISVSVDTTEDILHHFAEDITSRMPNLISLNIRTISKNTDPPVPMNAIENGIIQLLSPLRQLQKLKIPRFFFTARLAELLSHFSCLARISFECHDEDGAGDPEDIRVFKPELLQGSYSSLVTVFLCSTYEDSARFISLLPSPILTAFLVESPVLETPLMVHRLLNTISKKCHRLNELVLNSPCWAENNNDTGGRINLKTLTPLFTCKSLLFFEIYHHYPLDLTLEELEMVAKRLPLLTHLYLNAEPGYSEFQTLTLEALYPFARHCPNLKFLGLFIDASSDVIPSFRPTSPPPIFSKLEEFSVGTSRITNSVPVAMFLSRILPSSCRIDLDNVRTMLLGDQGNLWEEVNSAISLFVKIREEERAKARVEMKAIERGREVIQTVKRELSSWRHARIKQEEE